MSKVGRNDLCLCGSGKKYKNCCMPTALPPSPALPAPAMHNGGAADPSPVGALITKADQLYQQNDLKAARELYESIVHQRPDHAHGIHFLGVIAHREKNYELAQQRMAQSIELNPSVAEYYSNLGAVQLALDKKFLAIENLEKAVRLKPDFTNAMFNLGTALNDIGRTAEAVDWFQKTIRQDPGFDRAYNALGLDLLRQHKSQEAVQQFQTALKFNSTEPAYYTNCATALIDVRQYDDVILCCQRALELDPNHDEAYNNLGVVALTRCDYAEALRHFQRAIDINPARSLYFNNMAAVYTELKQFEKVIFYCQKATDLDPKNSNAFEFLGLACQELGELTIAEGFFSKASIINPNNFDNLFNLGLNRLAMGNLEQGWAGFEYRWKKRVPIINPGYSYPTWHGESMPDKSILVWGEQGIGDQIMFASLYEDLMPRFKKTTLACSGKLVTLYQRSFPEADIVSFDDLPEWVGTDHRIDVQSAAGSLARWLRPTLSSFPKKSHFLTPDPDRVTYWKKRLAELGPELKVGINWRTSVMTGNRPLYCTKIEQWNAIFAIAGVRFVNLQYDKCSAELQSVKKLFGVEVHCFPEVDLYDDIDETAALTKAMDLVISAPTAAGILAAAIGVPTWWLMTGFVWQKLGTGEVCWYSTLRTFEKTWVQDWESVIGKVAVALSKRVSTVDVDHMGRTGK